MNADNPVHHEQDKPVDIVGAGPAGLACAIVRHIAEGAKRA